VKLPAKSLRRFLSLGVFALKKIFDRIAALADPLRGRLLFALEGNELAVTELCTVFGMPQSTMSRHLKALATEGWVESRAEGVIRWYSMTAGAKAGTAGKVWEAVREELAELPEAGVDRRRIEEVIESRRLRGREFFAGAGGEWDRLRNELVGERREVLPLLGLLDPEWTVGDLGCGTGRVSELLAPFVKRVVAVDGSELMLEVARSRLSGRENVTVRGGELEQLPVENEVFDAAVLFLVLSVVADAGVVAREALRVLRPGGRLLIVDLTPHDREEYRQRFGHRTLGFAEARVRGVLDAVGFDGIRYVSLPSDADAKVPPLFAASGRRHGG
jgi:ArsR family transcriptional regulator